MKAAELGVSSAADIYIRKLERTGTATHTLGLKSAAARRELGVLAGELARGNFGALRGSGITLANRAGWIEQLMSPKGMMLGGLAGGVAAAVYGLGKAYYEGAKESETFNKQLILTGSYAGKTTGQLNAMAKSLAGNGVTQHDAAGVLAQVVGSGAFTGQAVAMVSRTATRMQENVGQSVDETIRQFKRLRDDPVNAAKELDRTLLLQYSQQQAQTEGQLAAAKLSTTEKMTEAHKQLLSFQQRIADLSGKKLTADEQSVLAHKDEIALALQKLDISQQDLQHQNALNELKKKTLTLTSQLADEESRVRQQHAMALATMGMGDQQRGRYEERLKIQQHYQEQLEQLKRDSKAKGTYGSDEYRQAEQALKGSLDRRLAEWADYNAKVDAAQGDWTLGASRALDNFLAQGGNVAGMTENVFTNAFNGMADSIANFAVTGKGSFRSLTVSILADLAKMEARIAASKLLGSVLAMFGFGTSAGGSTPSGAYSSAALSVIPNADGGVYRSAGLSQYSGSIVNRPTFFAFAKGAGVMGEAGPEAILPLRRGADGKLGVVAAGSGGMAMFAPEYNIEIHNDAGNGQIGPQALQAVYNIGKKAAIDFWQQQSRDGGIAGGGR